MQCTFPHIYINIQQINQFERSYTQVPAPYPKLSISCCEIKSSGQVNAIIHANMVRPVTDRGVSCPVDHKWRSCVYSQWTPGYPLLRLWPPVTGHIRDIYSISL